MTVWKPGIWGYGHENGVVSLVPHLLVRALTLHALRCVQADSKKQCSAMENAPLALIRVASTCALPSLHAQSESAGPKTSWRQAVATLERPHCQNRFGSGTAKTLLDSGASPV